MLSDANVDRVVSPFKFSDKYIPKIWSDKDIDMFGLNTINEVIKEVNENAKSRLSKR